jgi:hypothetical protein
MVLHSRTRGIHHRGWSRVRARMARRLPLLLGQKQGLMFVEPDSCIKQKKLEPKFKIGIVLTKVRTAQVKTKLCMKVEIGFQKSNNPQN